MENIFRTIRKIAVILGSAFIIFSICSNLYSAHVQFQFNSTQLLSDPFAEAIKNTTVISYFAKMFEQTCQAAILILIALAVDPAKVAPLFD